MHIFTLKELFCKEIAVSTIHTDFISDHGQLSRFLFDTSSAGFKFYEKKLEELSAPARPSSFLESTPMPTPPPPFPHSQPAQRPMLNPPHAPAATASMHTPPSHDFRWWVTLNLADTACNLLKEEQEPLQAVTLSISF